MIISGAERAMTAHHEGEYRSERGAFADQRLDDGDDAGGVGVHRYADDDADAFAREQGPGSFRGEEGLHNAHHEDDSGQ